MEVKKTTQVGDVVRINYGAADVFSSYGIDFCCGGKKSVEQACTQSKVDSDLVLADLRELKGGGVASLDYDSWDLGFLIDYIINTHHKYVTNEIQVILQYTDKVASVHGDVHPETIQIAELFQVLANDLESHLKDEEEILFPYVKQLLAGQVQNSKFKDHPILNLEKEHDKVGDILKNMSALSNGYMVPEDACNTFRVLYGKLREFESDLHKHVHLENNILFPKVNTLERK